MRLRIPYLFCLLFNGARCVPLQWERATPTATTRAAGNHEGKSIGASRAAEVDADGGALTASFLELGEDVVDEDKESRTNVEQQHPEGSTNSKPVLVEDGFPAQSSFVGRRERRESLSHEHRDIRVSSQWSRDNPKPGRAFPRPVRRNANENKDPQNQRGLQIDKRHWPAVIVGFIVVGLLFATAVTLIVLAWCCPGKSRRVLRQTAANSSWKTPGAGAGGHYNSTRNKLLAEDSGGNMEEQMEARTGAEESNAKSSPSENNLHGSGLETMTTSGIRGSGTGSGSWEVRSRRASMERHLSESAAVVKKQAPRDPQLYALVEGEQEDEFE